MKIEIVNQQQVSSYQWDNATQTWNCMYQGCQNRVKFKATRCNPCYQAHKKLESNKRKE